MRLNMKSILEKPVKINKGINIPLVVVTCCVIAVAIVVGTHKLWMPDSRDLMMLNNQINMVFNKKTINGTPFFKDVEKKIGEVSFMIYMDETANFEDLIFTMEIDGKYVYPSESYKVIKGNILPTQEKNKFQQEVLLQYSMPEDFYYLSVKVAQGENKTLEYQMDYRNFAVQNLSEKNAKYLISMDDINIEIINQEAIVKDLEKVVNGYQNSNKVLEQEVTSMEIKIKAITEVKAREESQTIIDNKKESVKSNQAQLEVKEKELSIEQEKLSTLMAEKEKQR